MFHDFVAPSCLPLGVVNLNQTDRRKTAMLGIALQHPPIRAEAQLNDKFLVSGARADVAAAYLEKIYAQHQLSQTAEIEIEQAIPAFMGLGSRPQMGLLMATIAAQVNEQDQKDTTFLTVGLELEPTHNLNVAASTQGGLLCVDVERTSDGAPQIHHRAELDSDEKTAWGFVLVMPRVSSQSDQYEADRMAALIHAQQAQDETDSGKLIQEQLYPAVAADDLDAFGAGLTKLQTINSAALEAMNIDTSPLPQTQKIFDVMQANGAVACGRSAAGFALYALTRGARSTINMRAALRDVFAHEDGDMIATIAQNAGIRVIEKQGTMQKRAY